MNSGREPGVWHSAGADLEKACDLLTSPSVSNLESSAVILSSVVERVRAQKGCLASTTQGPATREAVEAVRIQVGKARVLLDSAADNRRGWIQRLESLSDGYNAAGEALPIEMGGYLRLRA